MYRITRIGDSLWCGTNGGIVLFDLTDSTFTQYIDGLGFRSGNVTAVTIDRHGSLWAGFASTGVTRIDDPGSFPTTRNYSAAINGLVSDSITCIAASGDDVYYGSVNGMAKFYNGLPSPEVTLTDSLEGIRVSDLIVMGDSLLWIATERGMARYDRRTDAFVHDRIGPATSCCELNGLLYCASADGVQEFDPRYGWQVIDDTFPPYDDAPLLVASGGGELMCATIERVYRWSESDFVSIEAEEMKNVFNNIYRIGWGRMELQGLAVDGSGTPWVGGEYPRQLRGAYLTGYIGDTWRNRAFENLSHNSNLELSLDPAGGIWMSTWHYGISYKSDDDRWLWYTRIRADGYFDALSYWKIHLALLCDGRGRLWSHALNFDVDMFEIRNRLDPDDDVWRHFTLDENTITTNRFVKAKEDPAGNIWFLSDQQDVAIDIMKADSTDWLSISPSPGKLEAGVVFDCAFGQNGRVYLALSGVGVQRWYTRGYDWESLTSDLGDDWTMLFGTARGLTSITTNDTVIWTGSSNGLIRYEGGSVDSIQARTEPGEYGLIDAYVYDVEFDSYGYLWVATAGGLEKIDRYQDIIETYTSYEQWLNQLSSLYPQTVVSPLLSPVVKALEFDRSSGLLWIGTEGGLVSFDVSPPVPEEIPLSTMILYPNPVHIARGDDELRISRISTQVDIKVFNLQGELVHEAEDVSDGGVAWDLLTMNGFKATSGIYLVRVSDGKSVEVRKIAVVK
jgi:ligand-binding sensor domain-containing protein